MFFKYGVKTPLTLQKYNTPPLSPKTLSLNFHWYNMHLRPIQPADTSALLAFLNPEIENSLYWYETQPRTESDQWARFEKLIAQNYPVWVAELDNVTVGVGYLSAFRPQAGYRISAEHSVYVHPKAQGQGIGKALMGQLMKSAHQLGIEQLIGVIDNENTTSIALHQHLGFVQVGHLQNIARKHGQYRHATIWQKAVANLG